jgi:hypothetical protein
MAIETLKYLPEKDKEVFIKELNEAVEELMVSRGFSVFCEFLEDWEETAYIYANPELKKEIDASIAEANADKIKPFKP